MGHMEVICIFQTKSGPIWLVSRHKVGPSSNISPLFRFQ
jgi:hypothetical protein